MYWMSAWEASERLGVTYMRLRHHIKKYGSKEWVDDSKRPVKVDVHYIEENFINNGELMKEATDLSYALFDKFSSKRKLAMALHELDKSTSIDNWYYFLTHANSSLNSTGENKLFNGRTRNVVKFIELGSKLVGEDDAVARCNTRDLVKGIMDWQSERKLDEAEFSIFTSTENFIEELLEAVGCKNDNIKFGLTTELLGSQQEAFYDVHDIIDSRCDMIVFAIGDIMKLGYDPKLALTETLREISSRRQDPEQKARWANGGRTQGEKWQKDKSQEKKYVADYSKAKKGKK